MEYQAREVKSEEERRIFYEMAKEEGWNPTGTDVELYEKAHHKGTRESVSEGVELTTNYIVAESCQTKEIVGIISLLRIREEYGFVGYFIVKKELRGLGIGKLLWNTATEAAKSAWLRSGSSESLVLGLDAVPEQIPRYTHWGFSALYNNICYSGQKNDISAGFSSVFSSFH